MWGVVVKDEIWIGGADGEAKIPGVNKAVKAAELVAAGFELEPIDAPVLAGVGAVF
jgi:hypothetical protein